MDWLDEALDLSERERAHSLARVLDQSRAPAPSPVCVDCGDDIPAQRQAANPRARRCIGCQEVFEAKGRR